MTIYDHRNKQKRKKETTIRLLILSQSIVDYSLLEKNSSTSLTLSSNTCCSYFDQILVCDQSRAHFHLVILINEDSFIRIYVAASGQALCFTKCGITPTVSERFSSFLFANNINVTYLDCIR